MIFNIHWKMTCFKTRRLFVNLRRLLMNIRRLFIKTKGIWKQSSRASKTIPVSSFFKTPDNRPWLISILIFHLSSICLIVYQMRWFKPFPSPVFCCGKDHTLYRFHHTPIQKIEYCVLINRTIELLVKTHISCNSK